MSLVCRAILSFSPPPLSLSSSGFFLLCGGCERVRHDPRRLRSRPRRQRRLGARDAGGREGANKISAQMAPLLSLCVQRGLPLGSVAAPPPTPLLQNGVSVARLQHSGISSSIFRAPWRFSRTNVSTKSDSGPPSGVWRCLRARPGAPVGPPGVGSGVRRGPSP